MRVRFFLSSPPCCCRCSTGRKPETLRYACSMSRSVSPTFMSAQTAGKWETTRFSLLCLSAARHGHQCTRPGCAGADSPAVPRSGWQLRRNSISRIVCPGIFLYFLLNDRSARDPIALAACGCGFLIGFAPILFFLARDYQSFLRSNVQFHELMLPLRVPSPGAGIFRIAVSSLMFAILMCVPIGLVIAKAKSAWHRGGLDLQKVCGELLLLASAFAMAISPIYVFEQYLGPLAFLLLLFSAPWNSAGQASRQRYAILGLRDALHSIRGPGPVDRAIRDAGWQSAGGAGRQGTRAEPGRSSAIGYRCERKLYSAEPLFLLENDVKYPPELAAGPFWMFLRGEPVARKGKQFDLDAHIKAWNPDVVIWGFYLNSATPAEVAVDRTIRDYARRSCLQGRQDWAGRRTGHRAWLSCRLQDRRKLPQDRKR